MYLSDSHAHLPWIQTQVPPQHCIQLGVMACAGLPITPEVEREGSEFQGYPWLRKELEAYLNMRPYLSHTNTSYNNKVKGAAEQDASLLSDGQVQGYRNLCLIDPMRGII